MKVLVACNGKYKVSEMNNDGVVWFNESQGMRFKPEDARQVRWNKGWYKLFPRFMAAFGEPKDKMVSKEK
jgi:hypothetical protein